MDQLLIFPYNGNGLEALSCLGNNFEFIGFVDDTPEKQGKNKLGFDVFERSALQKYPTAKVLAVPGSPTSFHIRKKIIDDLNLPQTRFATVIHPNANISPLAKIGHNVLIMAGVVMTSNTLIGNHICILPNTVIHHDSTVGDYTLIGSNVTIAGNSSVGENCYIGSGTSIINNISVGSKSLIGMGSNVIKPVPENAKAAGNPAKLINK
jgi:sugar O-acyltransferase (sialic acid O-acetyltransferase NeuD family)